MRNAIEYPEPPPAPQPARPDRTGLWHEWRIAPQLLRLGLASPELRRQPRGDGSTVVLIPGWKGPNSPWDRSAAT